MLGTSMHIIIFKVIVLGHSRSIATKTSGIGGDNDGGASSPEAVEDFSVVAPRAVSAKLWSALSGLPDVVVAGEEEWQRLRIKQGKHRKEGFRTQLSRVLTCV